MNVYSNQNSCKSICTSRVACGLCREQSMELATLVVLLGACAVRAREAGPPLQPAPAYILVGTMDGKIDRCYFENPETCETFHDGADGGVSAAIVHGEYLFAGLQFGKILRCQWNRKDSCKVYHQIKDHVTSLAVIDGHLLAGDDNGDVLKCELNNPHGCTITHSFNESVVDILECDGYLYIATTSSLSQCITGEILKCTEVNVHGPINSQHLNSVTCLGHIIITHEINGDLKKFKIESMDVINIHNIMSVIGCAKDIMVFERKIFMLKKLNNDIVVSEGPNDRYYRLFVRDISPFSRSISFAYATHAMRPRYPSAAGPCLEQSPSAVFNYGVEQRALLEARVVRGKLRDARGVLLDTRHADRGRSGRAAVFAMGPDGQLLLSAAHRSGLVHITSLFAGAGEIHIEDGVVKRIVACSVYYWPTITLNRQVVDELYRRGYKGADDIQLEDCPYTCDA